MGAPSNGNGETDERFQAAQLRLEELRARKHGQ
jgi:hypothetical protein